MNPMKKSKFYPQVLLLLDVLPYIAKESCFALKGGTAINLFVRDFPRLSVDADLTYLGDESRDIALKNTEEALLRIKNDLEKHIGAKVSVSVREAPLREKPLWLRIHKHRYYCKTCRKPFTESVEGVWPRRKTTQHFRKALSRECEDLTSISLVRKRHKCSSGFTYKVHYDTLKTKINERKGVSLAYSFRYR